MTIKCPICGAVCVWEINEEIYRHVDSRTKCEDFSNPKVKMDENNTLKKVRI